MGQDQDVLQEILRRLEALDDHLGELELRLIALEHGTPVSEDVAPEASLETFESEVQSTAGISEEEQVREKLLAADVSKDEPEPPPLPPAYQPSLQEMPSLPVPPAPAAASASSTADATEIAASARQNMTFSQSTPAGFSSSPKPKARKESLEVRIASVWLPWIGLLFLALAAGFLAREYARGPVGKVVFAYMVSSALIIVGLWKERKYTHWARPVLAGGLAFSYFTSYAMGFVEPMRLLDSLGVKLAVLAANLALIFGVAQWKRSEVIAGTALVLGYITTGVVGNEMAAFSSSLALSVIAVVFLWINKWFVSTAVAAAATYLAHLYLWQAMPDTGRSQTELFWFHGLYLSLYFIVFTTAGLVGRDAARADMGKESHVDTHDPGSALSNFDILATLTQVNLAAFLGGMIALLKLTQVYWDQAWLFFLPMVVVFGGLGLLFAGLNAIQNMYLTAAVVSLTLGVVALLSPMWLPIYMSFQALALLWAARDKSSTLWQWLSLASLIVALLYIGSGGRVDVLRLSTNFQYIKFPWWTIASSTLLTLVYSGLWEKRFAESPLKIGFMVPGAVALAAGAIWNMMYDIFPEPELIPLFGLAIPAVGLGLILFRVHWPMLFMLLTAPFVIVQLWEAWSVVRDMNHLPVVTGLAALAVGLIIEKRGTGSREWDEWIWRGLFIWGQLLIVTDLLWLDGDNQRIVALVVTFAATVLAGWALRSSALAKSGYIVVPAVIIAGFPLVHTGTKVGLTAAAVAGILCFSAFPLATPWWQRRTGDRYPALNRWGQAGVVFVAGIILLFAADSLEWNKVLVSSSWALVAACFAVLGLFPAVAGVVVAFMVIAGIALVALATDVWSGNKDQLNLNLTTMACAGAVLLIVLAERVLRIVPRLWTKRPFGGDIRDWLSDEWARQLTGVVAISTLIMIIISLRLLPDMQNFYFTGAIVASAFVWIVFGFWFNESVYRKSGFAVLCFGLVKGLIWDLWSLKEPIYRVISGAVVGLLAIAASFLYTRFRGRLGGGGEDSESVE